MTLRPPTEQAITPEQMGVNIAATAYQHALSILNHWRAPFYDLFSQPGYTVADLQRMCDGMDADSIARGEGRTAFGLFITHQMQHQVLRSSLPFDVMADDPTESPVPYTVEFDSGYTPPNPQDPTTWDTTRVRIVFDPTAAYPTEPEE